jgi:hypothetical protein
MVHVTNLTPGSECQPYLPAGVELTCHAWLGASTCDKSMDRLAVGMTSGEVLVLSSRATEGAAAAAEGESGGGGELQARGGIVFVNTLRIPPADGLRHVAPPPLAIGDGAAIPFAELWGTTDRPTDIGDDDGAGERSAAQEAEVGSPRPPLC